MSGQLEFDYRNNVIVYVDGACKFNGTPNARAGLGVYFSPYHPHMSLSERVIGRQSNNTAEIRAAQRAIEIARRYGIYHLNIHTDSDLLIKSITQYIYKWKQNGWLNAKNETVVNKEDWLALEEAMRHMKTIEWTLVPAHSGVQGNEIANNLAQQGADLY